MASNRRDWKNSVKRGYSDLNLALLSYSRIWFELALAFTRDDRVSASQMLRAATWAASFSQTITISCERRSRAYKNIHRQRKLVYQEPEVLRLNMCDLQCSLCVPGLSGHGVFVDHHWSQCRSSINDIFQQQVLISFTVFDNRNKFLASLRQKETYWCFGVAILNAFNWCTPSWSWVTWWLKCMTQTLKPTSTESGSP